MRYKVRMGYQQKRSTKNGVKPIFKLSVKKRSKDDIHKPKKHQIILRNFKIKLKNMHFPTKIPNPPKELIVFLTDLILCSHYKEHKALMELSDIPNINFFSKHQKFEKKLKITANPWLAFRSYYSKDSICDSDEQHEISSILSHYWEINDSEREIWTLFVRAYKDENEERIVSHQSVENFKDWLYNKFNHTSTDNPINSMLNQELKRIIEMRTAAANEMAKLQIKCFVEDVFTETPISIEESEICTSVKVLKDDFAIHPSFTSIETHILEHLGGLDEVNNNEYIDFAIQEVNNDNMIS